jgi:SAM-dependent methyltransferase
MSGRSCPVCRDHHFTSLFAEANIDPSLLNQYSFASRKQPEYMHHRLLLCSSCDLLFADVPAAAESLQTAYEAAAFDSSAEAVAAAATYAKLIQPLLDRLPDRNGALDIGTGDGAFLHHLLSMEFTNVRGIEPSSAPLRSAHPRVRGLIEQGLFEPGRFSPKSFSLITCFQTIEHVPDPLGLCQEAVRLLKPGGILCLVGHNRRALSARLLGRKSPIFDIEHLQLFSVSSFLCLLKTAGLHNIRIQPIWNRYQLSYWARLFPFPSFLRNTVLKTLTVTAMGRLPLPLPAGNLVAVGVKPG